MPRVKVRPRMTSAAIPSATQWGAPGPPLPRWRTPVAIRSPPRIPGPSHARAPGSPRGVLLHALRGGDAEEAQAVPHDLPDRGAEPQPRQCQRSVPGDDPVRLLIGMEHTVQLRQVIRDPMRLP